MKNKYRALNNVKMDFSGYEEYQLSDLEMEKMKKSIENRVKNGKKLSWKKLAAVAACVAVVAALTQTSFAKSIVNGIIEKVSTGHNTVTKVDPNYSPAPIDKEILSETEENGVKIVEYADGSSVMVSYAGEGDISERHFYVNENEIANYTSFAPKLPSYLPEGYAFDTAYLMKDENGNASGDYLFIEYKNEAADKKIRIHERVANDETGYETGAVGEITQVDINGSNAALYDNTIMWEADGVSVEISGFEAGLDNDALVKMAKSVE